MLLDKSIDGSESPTGLAGMLNRNADALNDIVAERGCRVMDIMPAVMKSGREYHYITKARWSAVDLLRYMLELTKPAEVWISTWSINEDAARKLMQWIDEGSILSVKLLLDKKVRVRNPKPLQMLQQLPDVMMTDCHAKVSVCHGNGLWLTNCGSANFNKNKRIETGVVFTDKDVAEFHIKWMKNEFEQRTTEGT